MQTNQAPINDLVRAAFRPTSAAGFEIDHAISRARWRARQGNQAVVRVVPTGPERTIWYECRTHGCVSPIHYDGNRTCPRCGNPMLRHERVRADIARAERRAQRCGSWPRRRHAWRGRAAADQDQGNPAEAWGPARSAVTVSTCRALRQ